MAQRDWEEGQGDDFGVDPFSDPLELDLSRLFGEEAFAPGRAAPDESGAPRELREKEVRIVGVYEQRGQGQPPVYFVLVRDNRDRNLRIYIGNTEAYAIQSAVEGRQANRPLTHDLAKILIERMGWSVDRIVVDDEYNGIYYAKLSLIQAGNGAGNGSSMDVDCRPSDAIALAVRARAPIYVAEDVLEAEARKEQEL